MNPKFVTFLLDEWTWTGKGMAGVKDCCLTFLPRVFGLIVTAIEREAFNSK